MPIKLPIDVSSLDLDFAYHHPPSYQFPTPHLKCPKLHLVPQISPSRLNLFCSVRLFSSSSTRQRGTLWFPSTLPRLLTAAVTQAKLPLANLLSFFALYVAFQRSQIFPSHQLNAIGLRRVPPQQRAYNWRRIPYSEMPPRRPRTPL